MNQQMTRSGGLREDQIQSAVTFLKNPKVQSTSAVCFLSVLFATYYSSRHVRDQAKRVIFLEKKVLNCENGTISECFAYCTGFNGVRNCRGSSACSSNESGGCIHVTYSCSNKQIKKLECNDDLLVREAAIFPTFAIILLLAHTLTHALTRTHQKITNRKTGRHVIFYHPQTQLVADAALKVFP